MDDSVLQAHPLYLETERFAVPCALEEDVAQFPVRAQHVRFPFVNHLATAGHEIKFQIIFIFSHNNYPIITHTALVALQLAGRTDGAMDVTPACVGSRS